MPASVVRTATMGANMSGEIGDHPWRAELAERWTELLNRTAYLPSCKEATREQLLDLLTSMLDALRSRERIDDVGRDVGGQLIAMRATGADSLSRTLELLRDTLLDKLGHDESARVLTLMSGIAAGYAAADRESTLEQQETVKQALLRSKLRSDKQRRVREDHFHEVFTSAPVGVAICSLDGRIVEVNPALIETLGYGTATLETMRVHDLFHPDDVQPLSNAFAELAVSDGPQRTMEQRRLVSADGVAVECYLALSVLRDADDAASQFVVMVEDISELHRLQESFQHQALHDVMTGLPNRQFFRTRLEAALANLPGDTNLTLYHLGLNGFELINDGLGYEVGDSLIKVVAGRLERLIEGLEAMVARFGGTEFAILIRETPEAPPVATFASMINQELSEPAYIGKHGIAASASIGVVRTSAAEAALTSMLWSADVALRRAEAAGHRQWALFDPDRAPDERIEAKLAAVIPGALEMGDFSVRYRPMVAIRTGELTALEVELSWQPEDHAVLSGQQCLRLAEKSGVTLELRDWLLRCTWEQMNAWHAEGFRTRLAVGLSPHQAQDPDLVASVRTILTASELDPDWLCLSIPFAAVTGDGDEARENVGYLYEMGVRTVLHGFHASPEEFRSLRRLPIYAVRLAPELIRIVHEAEDDELPELQAVRRLVPLLNSDERWIVVSDISSDRQAQRWREMGVGNLCAGAGPVYGEPVEALEVPELFDRLAASNDRSLVE